MSEAKEKEETTRKDARGFPLVEPPKEKADSKDGERTDQAPLRRLG
jgi:hypothetical protein